MSLRLRLTLLTGLLTGGTVLLFALVFYLVLEANLLQEVDARLQRRADLVDTALRETSADRGTSLPQTPPLVEFEAPGLYVELIGLDGQTRAASPILPPGGLPRPAAQIATARVGRSAFGTVSAAGDDRLRLLVAPAHVGSDDAYLLLVAESLEPLRQTMAEVRNLLVAGGALALGLSVLGTALLTGQALAPIDRLTRAASRVAATGDYGARVQVSLRRDEVGQLAATINELIATVERALQQQRQFLADTSHELRSPLTVVLANLNLLRRDLDQGEREVSIREATAEAQRMRRLVSDLLLLGEADSAKVIARAPVRLDQLVEETVVVAARQAPDYPIRAEVDGPVVVSGDRERLTQLLRNLLENATQHTPSGTTVDVQLRREDGLAELTVSDTGPGISAEHLPRIWDRFYRVDRARSRTLGGTGLGLAIVKYIAEAHGGQARVASEEGRGTRFTILLPTAPL